MDLMTDKKTHPAMERIYRAMASRGLIAEERRQSALARLLNTSSQAVKNWESRGPSKDVRLEIQARYGISATWVENEAGDMLVDAGLSLSSNTQTSRMQAESLPAENASAGPNLPTPTITDLLEALKGEVSAMPDVVKKAVADLVTDYLKTPDPETGRAVAEAIERIAGKRP